MPKAEETQSGINESALWTMADKLRGNMEPSDCKHVAQLRTQQAEAAKLDAAIARNLEALGYGL